jgi:hypothetical protein
VSVESGSFTMQDGVISNNNRAAAGGGVFIRHGNFVMEGGSISRNTSAGNGGGVMTFGSFAMNGGTITENHAASGGGGVHGNFSIAGGSIFDNTSGDPNPLYKNINSVPVAQGDAFTIEGYREATDISFTVRDINGYVKDRVNGGRTYTCSAEVLGVGGPPQEVTWSISGNKSASTSIDPETGALAVGYDETAETLVLTATSVSQSEMSRDLSLPVDLFVEWNLKNKFDIAESGIAGVSAVFNALHEYIAAGHLSDANEKNIGVGDFVNLYSLAVADTVAPDYSRGSFNIMNAVLPYDRGSTLRLIVVGVNSYKGLNGNGDSPAGDHLVFQFQNIPVSRRMEATNTNAAGYTGSEMRKYLSPVEGVEDSGCFYQGLVKAGVPASVFYSPRRALSNGTGIEIIEDPVWLPTAAEMNAFAINEAAGKPAPPVGEAEAQAAQPVFAYYNADTINKYPTLGSRVYWTGSPDTQGGFITYINYFSPDSTLTYALGVVPAFCVH